MVTQTKCRILIVDDEVLIRQGIKYYLDWEKEGYEIVGEAANGKEALELIEETQPHILLTDIVMPLMDGEELTRLVKEKYPSIEIIILSSFSEYEYVRSTFQHGVVDYFLKPKLNSNELLHVLNRAKQRIPISFEPFETVMAESSITKLVIKLISGYQLSLTETEYKQLFPFNSFCLLGINTAMEGSDMLVQKKVTNLIESSSKQLTYHFISVDKQRMIYLINIEKLQAQDFQKNMMIALENENPITATYILSTVYTSFYETSDIYRNEIEKFYPFSFYYPDISFIIADNWKNNESRISSFNQELFNQEWKNKRFEKALTYLEKYIQEFSTCYMIEIAEFKNFFHSTLFGITVMLENMELKDESLEDRRNRYFTQIDLASTAKETVSYFNEFIEELRKSLKVKSHTSDHMRRLITYIESNYSQPLTLTDLAAHFHFNPSYLSNYFSSHHKEGFVEFLNRVRIEEASKLLRNKDLSIADISGLVGYTDHSYFCKVFKKRKGMSPSHYRRTNK